MYTVVGVRFKKAGKIYYFDPLELPVEKEQSVIVETARGIEYGKVVVGKKQVGETDVVLPLKKVIRIADDADARVVEENKLAAKNAFATCLNKIKDHDLKMKLVDVEFTFDRNKIIFISRLKAGSISVNSLRIWPVSFVRGSSFAKSESGMKPRCSAGSVHVDASYAVRPGWATLSPYRSRWLRIRACR